MTEVPVSFGPGHGLMGIVTTPEGGLNIGCIVMNAGVIHRVGPHRINVRLARALAERGITTMRLDLSGIGESQPAQSTRQFKEQSVDDLRAAMDYLESEYGIRRFILIGICSGAVNAYWAALADARVSGLLMFDGLTYATKITPLVRRWKRFKRASWSELIGMIGAVVVRSTHRSGSSVPATSPDNPTRAEFRTAMDALVARSCGVYLIYSGGITEYHNYSRQLRDAFRGAAFLPHVRYEYCPDMDHTITATASQRQFVSKVENWALEIGAATGR